MQYEVHFVHSINRFPSGSFTSQSINESRLTVEAGSINQAERMVTSMFGRQT